MNSIPVVEIESSTELKLKLHRPRAHIVAWVVV